MSISRNTNPTEATSITELGSGNAWSNITDALTDDAAYASVDIPLGSGDGYRSKILRWYDFGFDASSFSGADGPRIVGVKVSIDGYTTNAGGGVTDETLQLDIGGTLVGSNHPSGLSIWPTSSGTRINVGGDGDLWGLDELSMDDIGNIGVQLILLNAGMDSSGETGYAGYCEMTLYAQIDGSTFTLMGVGH